MKISNIYVSLFNSATQLNEIKVQAEIEAPLSFLFNLLLIDRESIYNYVEGFDSPNHFGFNEYLDNWDFPVNEANDVRWLQLDVITYCRMLYDKYKETGDFEYKKAYMDLIPCSKIIKLNLITTYSTLRKIYFKIPHINEWEDYIKFIESLPHSKELICIEEKKDENTKKDS